MMLGGGTRAVGSGSAVWCFHNYLATFKIAAHKEWGLSAETIASETKYFLCCLEAGASKAGLLENTTTKPQLSGKTRVKQSASQISALQHACALPMKTTAVLLLRASPRGCARLFCHH